ncbi:MAG: NAD(P)-dependent oxidoreductase, partial [Planctomycetota bacterium]
AAGVMVTNTPGVLTGTTADLAFALLMAAARRVVEADRFAREGRFAGWEMDMMLGVDVHGATLGIIGMGRIGEAVAHRGHAGFGMRVLYHDVDRRPDLERESGYEFCSVDDLLAQSDFVSLHVPLTDRTRHLLRAPELARMRPTAVLINTSRGPVVHEEALAAALANGTIRAAGLDVFEDEPAIHPALRNLPNVVLTPHIGSASIRTRTAMAMMAVDNLLAALRGETPPRLINPEVLRPADP